jgi:molybdate transport system substrate-binding protein
MKLPINLILFALPLLPAMQGWAADIKIMSGGAPQQVLAVLTPEFEKQTGNHVQYKFEVLAALQKRLEAGETPDMVLMPVQMIDGYVKSGKMRADGRASLGRLGIIVVVKQGAPKPDISTVESFRKTLLDARSVGFSTPMTPSGVHLGKVIQELGIADALQNKLTRRAALDGGIELIAKGEVDIGIYPASEVAAVKGLSSVGPLPATLRSDSIYAAAVTTDSAAPSQALAFIKFLADPANRKHWQDAGFDPPEP